MTDTLPRRRKDCAAREGKRILGVTLNQVRRLGLAPSEVIDLLGSLVRKTGSATQFVGGQIGFRIHGQTGGTWIMDLSVSGGRFFEDEASSFNNANTRFYAFARDFAALVTAPDTIVGLLETGRVVVEGDKAKLGRLAKLIRQGQGRSQVGVRCTEG